MELFLLTFKNAIQLSHIDAQFQQFQHFNSLQLSARQLLCSVSEQFALDYEHDAHTLIETLLVDFHIEPLIKSTTFAYQTEITHALFEKKRWENISLSGLTHSLASALPLIAQQKEIQMLTKNALNDTLIQTLRFFLENNLNGLETANQMFIHRNTLNYRIQQIHERIGIDPRTFYGAMYFYHIIHSSSFE